MRAPETRVEPVRNNPSPEHEWRVDLLRSLASLTGHVYELTGPLPDGSIPDVVMVSLRSGSVFVGDGKATEGPRDSASQARIYKYFDWIVAQVRRGGRATFAICSPSLEDALGWSSLLEEVAHERHLEAYVTTRRLSGDAAVAAAELQPSVSPSVDEAVTAQT